MIRKKIIAASAGTAMLTAVALIPGGASAGDIITTAVDITANTAYIAAGVIPSSEDSATAKESMKKKKGISEKAQITIEESTEPSFEHETSFREDIYPIVIPEPITEQQPTQPSEPPSGIVISLNISDYDDGLDYTAEGTASGNIYRQHRGRYNGSDYIDLSSGAQVRNCTFHTPEELAEESLLLPDLRLAATDEPQVLIIHTHTTESFDPYQRDYYDESFPCNSQDSDHNMVAVGKVLADTLAANGISVVHDGTIHDYPNYTGAYDRSEATIRSLLEEYPSIKIIIDLHRDAMVEADGSRIAPVTEIDEKNAAQFMIIAGCDDGRFGNMPNYMQNYRLACLFQNSCEELYPQLARPILFDYRNYNQHISNGSLLIEVGSHGNSLDEALYTAELLGNGLADALHTITE